MAARWFRPLILTDEVGADETDGAPTPFRLGCQGEICYEE